jgi:hypothetical protein
MCGRLRTVNGSRGFRRTANNSRSGERTGAVAALLAKLTKYPESTADNSAMS